jgi:hypothetical protein
MAPHPADAKPPGMKTRWARSEPPRSPPAHPDTPTPAHPAMGAPALTRTFQLVPNPGRVDVWLDNIEQPHFDSWRDRLTIEWKGVHRVEVRNDKCCERFVAEFGPDKPNKVVDLENEKILAILPRKLGNVTIKLEPPRDDVPIELRELGDNPKARVVSAKNGEPTSIPFDAQGSLRKTMQVSVYPPDKPVTKKQFEIGAGEKVEVPVPLD